MTLAEARELALETRAASRRGEDPMGDSPTRSDSFKTALDSYIADEQIGRHGNTSATETKTVMRTNCADWLPRPVATIRSTEIEKLLRLVRDGDPENGLKPRRYLANRLYSHLKDFFSWCARGRTINASPMVHMERPFMGEKPRDLPWFKGAAADKAIKAIWLAAERIGGDEGRYLKMLLLTGKRKSALAAMRWEEIDATWFWDPPRSNSKNKRLHPIPLPKKAQQVLHPRAEQGPVFGGLKLDLLQAKVRKLTGISDFIFHGTRHVLGIEAG